MFRRKKNDPLAAYEAVRHEDRLVLAAMLGHGADLTQPRHVLHYIYELADETAAQAAAAAVAGWQSTVNAPPEGYEDWSVTFERQEYVLTPENVATDAQTFAGVADAYGGRYDGWEASV